ncbi:FAD-dependent thymidylate synthase [bacterium]|nr:FAD-dependent thymidylate synthase [bacterium]
MGSDRTVVNAARLSFDNTSDKNKPLDAGDERLIKFLVRGCPMEDWDEAIETIFDGDEVEGLKKIKYLRSMPSHFAPFTHPQITLIEEMPIQVERQRFKHQRGKTYSSISYRYIYKTPDVYSPANWRRKPEGSIKQGSSGDFNEIDNLTASMIHDEAVSKSLKSYNQLIEMGACPEQARGVLPVNMVTKFMVTGSLYAFANAYIQRSDGHAQWEIQQLAKQWDEIIRPLYPVSWKTLVDGDYT